jgi:hypothetical protein
LGIRPPLPRPTRRISADTGVAGETVIVSILCDSVSRSLVGICDAGH